MGEKKWKILAPQTWQWSTTRGILLAHTVSPTSHRELPICSWEIEQILLFLQDKRSFSAWVNNSKLHFIRLLMPWARSKQSEKCNGPHKTGHSQKNVMVPIKHVVSCFTALLVQTSQLLTAAFLGETEEERSRNFGQWVSRVLQETGPADVNVKPALESDWIYLCQALKTSRVGDIGGMLTSSMARWRGTVLLHYCELALPLSAQSVLSLFSSPPHLFSVVSSWVCFGF